MDNLRPLAVVTGASSGIGYALARIAADAGYDLVIAADTPEIVEAAQALGGAGVWVDHIQVDLATRAGVEQLLQKVGDRPVDVLLANAGHGLGGAFLDQAVEAWMHVVGANVTGTLYLTQRVGQRMRERGQGRILFTGSIAGLPGSVNAVYNGSQAFIDSFAFALRNELKDTGVSVTVLMPGPTDTNFFDRAHMTDTKVGQGHKDDPADVARTGWDAMMRGDGDVVAGLKNKAQAAAAAVTPQSALAEPGSGS